MREPGTLRSVFISSTSVDLRAYRAAVKDAVEKMDLHPKVMENFGAQGEGDAIRVSREEVAQSDFYILIVAWRYGYVPSDNKLSVTQQEYDEARVRNLPCFVYLADPATDGQAHDSPEFPATSRDADPEYRAKLEAFRAMLQTNHVCGFFANPNDLALGVVTALHKRLLHESRKEQAREGGVPYDLPPPAFGFVGRKREIEELCADLRRGESIGLSAAVVGMAGVGKSALASEVVHALAADVPERFPGGITWVNCNNLTGLSGLNFLYDHLLYDWSTSLAPEVAARDMTSEEAITLREHALRARRRPPAGQAEPDAALVMLDNVEPGLPLARALATLNALGIRALITSRAEPSVRGLRIKRLDVLDPKAAVALFAERYAAVEGKWDVARDAESAVDIVEALGRLPLAIELAAARAGLYRMSVAALTAELGTPNVLAKLHDQRDRTASVRYAFEQTVGTDDCPGELTPIQQARFVALGLPAGPDWQRGVIETYLDNIQLKDAESPPGTDDLGALIALSLVAVVASGTGADATETTRLRLHPLLREYASDLWQSQTKDIRKVYLEALVRALGSLVAKHKAANPQDFTLLAREEELIAAALTQAADAEAVPDEIAEVVDNLSNYLYLGGRWALGVTLLRRVLAIRFEQRDPAEQGRTLNNLGKLAHSQGHIEVAERYYERALTIAREMNKPGDEASVLIGKGTLAYDQEKVEEAQIWFEQALKIARILRNRHLEGNARLGLGVVSRSKGMLSRSKREMEEAQSHFDGARVYFEESLAIARGEHDGKRDPRSEAITLNNLGSLAADLGRLDEARTYREQALAIQRDLGDRYSEGVTLGNLGALAQELGHDEQAQKYFEQALAIFSEIGAIDDEKRVQTHLNELREDRPVTSALLSADALQEAPLPRPENVRPTSVLKSATRRWWPFGRRGDK
ncbi:MAG TPA: tetratricopeptide repeat protein [Ktedonobacterales bacterium]|jgi:tetratricopeptide (TPR) repeat protein